MEKFFVYEEKKFGRMAPGQQVLLVGLVDLVVGQLVNILST